MLNFFVAGDDAGLDQKIATLRAIVHATDADDVVRSWASQLVANVPRREYATYAKAVYEAFVDFLQFKRDTRKREDFRTPQTIIEEIAANGRASVDCDDVAALGVSLLRAMGFDACFIVSSPTEGEGGWSHIFFGYADGDAVIALDPQERKPIGPTIGPAWERAKKFRVYFVDREGGR